jgi:halogenation protein CepH
MPNDSNSSYDVIVVGGGPGGSTAATFIAMQGHKVLLLEKHKYPIYKIGESLLPATVHGICPMLGVSQKLKDANFITKFGGTFQWGQSTEPWTFSFSTSSRTTGATSTAFQVERMIFDKILLDNARAKGVQVCERVNVHDLLIDHNRVIGLTASDDAQALRTYHARYVIDASGHESRIARFAGERIYSNFFHNIALFGYYKGGGRLPAPCQGNILCVAFEYGWFWYIPLRPDLTSVGAVVSREYAEKIAGRHSEAMEQFIGSCPRIKQLLATATRVTTGPYGQLRIRKDYSYSNTKFWIPGLALVGDAACFIDPVFSSGVHLATYSALLVARSVNTVMKGDLNEASCFDEFEARYRREYALFHDFLLAFYDANKSYGSSFWDSRSVANSSEITNEPFISLVAGMGGAAEPLYETADQFLNARKGLGDIMFPQQAIALSLDPLIEIKRTEFYRKFLGEVTQLQIQALLKTERPMEHPLFPNGLVPSRDGLHWAPSPSTNW